MATKTMPTKRRRLDSGYVSSPTRIPMNLPSTTQANNAVVLYDPTPARTSPTSMEELVRSPAINLKIGPEQSQITVQAALFRGISEPLNYLLSSNASGHTDTTTIDEYLRHDDKDAFLQLVSMCYSIVVRGEQVSHTTLPTAKELPSKAIVKNSTGSKVEDKSLVKCPTCNKSQLYIAIICDGCNDTHSTGLKPFLDLQLAQSHGGVSKQAGVNALPSSSGPLDAKDKVTGKVYPLMHFAKVFHLASKYDVLGLQISALKAFERRLKRYADFALKDTDELLDVLRYLASKSGVVPEMSFTCSSSTGDNGDVLHSAPGAETCALLKSLMRYVVAHVGELLREEEFREIVAEHGIIGLELMTVLQETILASDG